MFTSMQKLNDDTTNSTEEDDTPSIAYGRWKLHDKRDIYKCTDGTKVIVPRRYSITGLNWSELIFLANCIYYDPSKNRNALPLRCVVAEASFNRDMAQITKVPEKAKSITLPRTAKVVAESACQGITSLKSVVLNEGLEVIEKYAFYDTGLRSVVLPGSLRTISYGAFNKCTNLKRVVLCEGIEVLGSCEYKDGNDITEGVF